MLIHVCANNCFVSVIIMSFVAAVTVVQLSGLSESWSDLSCAVAVCQTSSLSAGLD